MLNHSKYNRDVGWVLQHRGKPKGGFEFVLLCEIPGDFKTFPSVLQKTHQEEETNELS